MRSYRSPLFVFYSASFAKGSMVSTNFSGHKNYAPLPSGYRLRSSSADKPPARKVLQSSTDKPPAQLVQVLQGNATLEQQIQFALQRVVHRLEWLKHFIATQDLKHLQNYTLRRHTQKRNVTAMKTAHEQEKISNVFKNLENL